MSNTEHSLYVSYLFISTILVGIRKIAIHVQNKTTVHVCAALREVLDGCRAIIHQLAIGYLKPSESVACYELRHPR